jgi:hypothetical protein
MDKNKIQNKLFFKFPLLISSAATILRIFEKTKPPIMKKIILPLLAFLICNGTFAQNDLKATSINVFKNGTYFIVKEGQVGVKNGTGVIQIPLAPLQSTFWITTTKEAKINSISYVTDTMFLKKPPQSYYDFLQANKTKKIRILYQATDKDLREVAGTLQDVIKSTGLVRIRQADGKTTFLPLEGILELSFDDNPIDVVKYDSVARLAKIAFTINNGNTDIKLNYMQTGIQWIPSYNVKVISDKELQLEMNALVENYAEAVNNVDLTLTVGNPTFLYGSKTDPLAFNYLTSLVDTRTAAPVVQFAAQMYSNSIVSEERAAEADYQNYTTYETDGEKSNDLFMYKLGKVNLPFESKTNFLIFSSKLPYKDVYEVSIGDVANYSYYGYNISDPEKRYDVYHSFLITNATSNPFTTGPVFVQNENLQPLAQDLLKYTPTGGNVSVQLAKAGDVVVKNKEEEVSRTENVKKLGKTYYSKVVIKGTITIENLQDKKIQLNVNKDLTANVLETSNDGKIIKSGKYYGFNPYSQINWEIPLGDKEKKSLTYQYEVYVSSGSSN